MTVVAFRDGVLAADSLVTDGTGLVTGSATKIGRYRNVRYALVGDMGNARRLLAWVCGPRNEPQPDTESGSVIWLPDEGPRTIYGQGTSWPVADASYHAWGCGARIALGAMYAGSSAVAAVAAAIAHDTDCGGAVVTIE